MPQAQVVGPRVLRPWFATDYNRISGDFLHSDVFLSGNYLVHPDTRHEGPGKGRAKRYTVVWEVKAGR